MKHERRISSIQVADAVDSASLKLRQEEEAEKSLEARDRYIRRQLRNRALPLSVLNRMLTAQTKSAAQKILREFLQESAA